MNHELPIPLNLTTAQIADCIFQSICTESVGMRDDWVNRMKELKINPFSGWCREYCIATLLLASDGEDYDLLLADDETGEDSGAYVIGAKCHFWLARKDDHGIVVDPTHQQFMLMDLEVPHEYLSEGEYRICEQPLSERLIEMGLPFAKELVDFINSGEARIISG